MILGNILEAASAATRLYASTLPMHTITNTSVSYTPDTASFRYAGLLNNNVANIGFDTAKRKVTYDDPRKKLYNNIATGLDVGGGILSSIQIPGMSDGVTE